MQASLVQIALIGVGALAIGAAMYRTRKLMELEEQGRRGQWQVLRVMMGCFVLGYAGAAGLILMEAERVMGWLVGVVFLGGAVFVYAVVTMSVGSLRRLAASTHSRESFQITLDTVVDAIITIDEKGTVLFANSGTSGAFGYSAEELIGRNVSCLMPGDIAKEHDGYLRRYVEGGTAQIIGVGREVIGRRKDGTTFPADLAVNEMHVGGERRFVGSLRDITERKEVDRMKSEFISVVSHELRTPLTSIRGSLGLLLGGVGGELSEKGQRLLDVGVRSCDRLVRLINDILDVEKIESRAIELELHDVSLSRLLEAAVQSSGGFATEHDVRIEKNDAGDILVHADADRIIQVITNLLSNAIKFSPSEGVVELRAEFVRGCARIEVHDDGPGIPDDFRSRIFDKFAQADGSSTRKIPGSGLGLSISKAIVEQHGGTIGFESSAETGTTFHFELPGRQQRRARRTPATAVPEESRWVLICEDDQDLAAIIAETLSREGCVCDVAFDAAQAKDLLGQRAYEALFLDLFLPGQDGISLIRELRAQPSTRALPIVVVSAVAEAGRAQLAGQTFQVIDWIDKPFEEGRLRLALATALSGGAPARARVLHVEDDPDVATVVRGVLETECEVLWAPTLADARTALSEHVVDLVLLDLQLPDGNGLELVRAFEDFDDPPRVVVFSARDFPNDLREQVEAVLAKGRTSNDSLIQTVRRLLQ